MRDTYLEIDIDKIRSNIKALKKLTGDTKFSAVIKANGYGLGAVEVAKNIEDLVDYFCVARFSEAKELRDHDIAKPILILGYVDYHNLEYIRQTNIEIPIYDLKYAKTINEKATGTINCHLAIDTGHGRIGFRNYEIDKILKLKKLKNLHFVGCFSHFSSADEEDKAYTQYQKQIFDEVLDKIRNQFDFKLVHISNDAGFIKYNYNYDMVRSGICIYGIYPSNYIKSLNRVNLECAFHLYSTVTMVKEVKKGSFISYSRTYQAEDDVKIATVSIGYADGYIRSLSNIGNVLINGKLATVCGRVCMDQIMVDCTGIEVKIGDRVLIYPDIDKEAQKIGTITYELMTTINMRVPRIYIKDDKIYKEIDYNWGE